VRFAISRLPLFCINKPLNVFSESCHHSRGERSLSGRLLDGFASNGVMTIYAPSPDGA
jgi:hypothetical protein